MTTETSHRGREDHPGHKRARAAVVLAALILPLMGVVARADCQEDISKLMQRRQAAVEAVNSNAKAKNGKLDPVAACPRLKTLASLEGQASAYLTKNKDWCNLPPDFVDKMATSYKRTVGFAAQACNFAVKMKQMQQQQAQQQQQQQAPKLPAGPL